MEDETRVFLPKTKQTSDFFDQEGPELKKFRSYLRWVYVDQSNFCRAAVSWSVFFVVAFVVPLLSHFLLECSDCDSDHTRPYHIPVQISLTVFATLSFLNLSRWDRKYGLRKFLFLDKVIDESEKIQQGYAEQLQKYVNGEDSGFGFIIAILNLRSPWIIHCAIRRTMKLILLWGLPCFLAESVYKIWWFVSGASELPYYGNMYVSDILLCALELFSWIYRTSIFFLVCVFFRLICHLQILKLEEFAQVFQKETDVASILVEHLKHRRSLRVISHRFRFFILASLLLVTASQLIFLLMTTKTGADVDILRAGELALVSITLVSGLYILLRSATKITHKAQSITGLAAKWHICATINSFDHNEGETPRVPPEQIASTQVIAASALLGSSDEDEVGDEEDELDNTKLLPIYTHTISFHKRQALVTYMENNRAGITVYGFMLDRTWLHSIVAIQLALCLWLLNKTIGV